MVSGAQGKSLEEKIAEGLYQTGAIIFKEVKLTSGKKSPYYVNVKETISYPKIFHNIVSGIWKKIEGIQPDKITAVPTGGLPFTGAITDKEGIPMTYIREEQRDHGPEDRVEGEIKEGELVAILDDVSSTGGSLLYAVEKVRQTGGKVKDTIVVVDRNQGAAENLKEEGVDLHYVINTLRVIEHLRQEGMISEEEYLSVVDYIKEQS